VEYIEGAGGTYERPVSAAQLRHGIGTINCDCRALRQMVGTNCFGGWLENWRELVSDLFRRNKFTYADSSKLRVECS